jgi:hypothetical protein
VELKRLWRASPTVWCSTCTSVVAAAGSLACIWQSPLAGRDAARKRSGRVAQTTCDAAARAAFQLHRRALESRSGSALSTSRSCTARRGWHHACSWRCDWPAARKYSCPHRAEPFPLWRCCPREMRVEPLPSSASNRPHHTTHATRHDVRYRPPARPGPARPC